MNKSYQIFIDGSHGTTGLELENRLASRDDIQLLSIDEDKRKDPAEKQAFFDQADVIFLCLPDDHARQSAAMISPDKIVIDASTAHRTLPDWVYGFPELSTEQRQAIATSKRICVPGCHATGFIALVAPLVNNGLLEKDEYLSCFSITGYSGGGKDMIAQYQATARRRRGPQPYALGLSHKHLPEMRKFSGLTHNPHFIPIVGDIERGMLVTVPLLGGTTGSLERIWLALAQHYKDSHFVRIQPLGISPNTDDGFLDPTVNNLTNRMDLFVFGHDEQASVIARFDNLGKGSSGAAVQCMNIALGIDEVTGLKSLFKTKF